MGFGVHQCSVLSPLRFIIVLEVMSGDFRVGVNMEKFMATGINLDVLCDSGRFPCAVRHTRVGHVSGILCSKCVHWVHKKCTGQKTLVVDPEYVCPRCWGDPCVLPIDGCPFEEVQVGDSSLENVDGFCYLGDMLSAGGGCGYR